VNKLEHEPQIRLRNLRVELLQLAQKWQQFANVHFELRRIATTADGLINPDKKSAMYQADGAHACLFLAAAGVLAPRSSPARGWPC
jgi:hypothetical protein